MLLNKEDIDSLRKRLLDVLREGGQYFADAKPIEVVDEDTWPRTESLEMESEGARGAAEALRATIKALSVDIAGAARGSPLLAEADMQELRHDTRQMLASVRFREYRHSGVYVHHDEDVVLGVDPPSHEEVPIADVPTTHQRFDAAGAKVLDLIDLLSPTETPRSTSNDSANYRPNTAFIMMAIDESKPDLEDTKEGIKEVFKAFGIRAITADEIEHEGAITARILDEIETSEFHIADLTHERPNVYYEIGYADARNKRVILFRKKDTKVHFDVAHRNCPEYKNTAELKRLLRKRLESITNRPNPARRGA